MSAITACTWTNGSVDQPSSSGGLAREWKGFLVRHREWVLIGAVTRTRAINMWSLPTVLVVVVIITLVRYNGTHAKEESSSSQLCNDL